MAASVRRPEIAPVLDFAICLARTKSPFEPQTVETLVDGFLAALGQESKHVWGRRAGMMVHSSFREKAPARFQSGDFEDVQKAVGELLGTVRSGAIRAVALPSLRFVLLPGRTRRQLQVVGTARDVFLYLLHAALAMSEGNLIHFCPDCGQPFLASGKRRFCCRECANRAMYRRWKQKHGRSVVGKKNRRAYKKRQGRRKVMTYRPRRLG
jgi:hypothetical protein